MAPNIRPLSPELQERAKKELNEVPERIESDIAAIREWLKKQPHILGKPDDQIIVSFLRGCKHSLERTKEKIDLYYTMRTALPEFFKDRDIKSPAIQEMFKLGGLFILPETDDQGRPIFFVRSGLGDPNKHSAENFLKSNLLMMDYILKEDDHAVICGNVSVIDTSAFTMGHMVQLTPSFIKKATTCSQEAYPLRPKAMHFVKVPSFFETVFNLFKSFNKEKIRKRLFMHGKNIDTLYKDVPQKLLPTEYGGTAGTVQELNDAWVAKVETLSDWYISPEGALGVDESKRPGRPKTHQDLFGIEGSFRKLDLD